MSSEPSQGGDEAVPMEVSPLQRSDVARRPTRRRSIIPTDADKKAAEMLIALEHVSLNPPALDPSSSHIAERESLSTHTSKDDQPTGENPNSEVLWDETVTSGYNLPNFILGLRETPLIAALRSEMSSQMASVPKRFVETETLISPPIPPRSTGQSTRVAASGPKITRKSSTNPKTRPIVDPNLSDSFLPKQTDQSNRAESRQVNAPENLCGTKTTSTMQPIFQEIRPSNPTDKSVRPKKVRIVESGEAKVKQLQIQQPVVREQPLEIFPNPLFGEINPYTGQTQRKPVRNDPVIHDGNLDRTQSDDSLSSISWFDSSGSFEERPVYYLHDISPQTYKSLSSQYQQGISALHNCPHASNKVQYIQPQLRDYKSPSPSGQAISSTYDPTNPSGDPRTLQQRLYAQQFTRASPQQYSHMAPQQYEHISPPQFSATGIEFQPILYQDLPGAVRHETQAYPIPTSSISESQVGPSPVFRYENIPMKSYGCPQCDVFRNTRRNEPVIREEEMTSYTPYQISTYKGKTKKSNRKKSMLNKFSEKFNKIVFDTRVYSIDAEVEGAKNFSFPPRSYQQQVEQSVSDDPQEGGALFVTHHGDVRQGPVSVNMPAPQYFSRPAVQASDDTSMEYQIQPPYQMSVMAKQSKPYVEEDLTYKNYVDPSQYSSQPPLASTILGSQSQSATSVIPKARPTILKKKDVGFDYIISARKLSRELRGPARKIQEVSKDVFRRNCVGLSKELRKQKKKGEQMDRSVYGGQFMCCYCRERFHEQEAYSEHMFQHAIEKRRNSDEQYMCSHCDVPCGNVDMLQRHVLRSVQVAVFKCRIEDCSVKYDSWCQLKNHMQDCHEDKIYKCDICQGIYLNENELEDHKLACEAGFQGMDEPYLQNGHIFCKTCYRVFTNVGYYTHIRGKQCYVNYIPPNCDLSECFRKDLSE